MVLLIVGVHIMGLTCFFSVTQYTTWLHRYSVEVCLLCFPTSGPTVHGPEAEWATLSGGEGVFVREL